MVKYRREQVVDAAEGSSASPDGCVRLWLLEQQAPWITAAHLSHWLADHAQSAEVMHILRSVVGQAHRRRGGYTGDDHETLADTLRQEFRPCRSGLVGVVPRSALRRSCIVCLEDRTNLMCIPCGHCLVCVPCFAKKIPRDAEASDILSCDYWAGHHRGGGPHVYQAVQSPRRHMLGAPIGGLPAGLALAVVAPTPQPGGRVYRGLQVRRNRRCCVAGSHRPAQLRASGRRPWRPEEGHCTETTTTPARTAPFCLDRVERRRREIQRGGHGDPEHDRPQPPGGPRLR